MTTTTSSKSYANVTNGDLTFSGITVNETDVINGSSVLNSFTSNDVSPAPDTVGSEIGMSWSAFSMLVGSDGSGVRQTVDLAYNVSTSGADYITAIDSIYAIDEQAGDGTFTAVENIYDSNNDLLGTQTFVSGAPAPAPTQLTTGVQNAHVTLQVTETANSSGSLISASILAQLFTETPATALAALGDYVWLDSNDNGLQDTGETGVAGVTVDLLNSTATSVIAVTTTNSTGYYHFTGLLPGVYDVQFFAPTGDNFTLTSVGTNTAIDFERQSDDGPDRAGHADGGPDRSDDRCRSDGADAPGRARRLRVVRQQRQRPAGHRRDGRGGCHGRSVERHGHVRARRDHDQRHRVLLLLRSGTRHV